MSRGATRRAAVAVMVAAAVTLVTGCGAGSTATTPVPAAAGPMPVLAASAVPGLAVSTRSLPASRLAKDATIHDLGAQLAADGYVAGRERTFQGPSRDLTLVTSRALSFASPTGAAAFLSYVHAHADQWFGLTTTVSALDSAGRQGWLFHPPACACHLANPLYVGVVRDGRQLAWLSINGPAATTATLDRLLAPDRSTTA
jgi:hypothetical protein